MQNCLRQGLKMLSAQQPIVLRAAVAIAATGFVASVALPAGRLWMQGSGIVMLVAFVPLFFLIEWFFDFSTLRRAVVLSMLASYLSCLLIEIGFFHWGLRGVETFLNLPRHMAAPMAFGIAAAQAGASVLVFLFFIAIRAYSGSKILPLLGASLAMPLVEHLAPRLFYFTYGSFLSLSPWSAPLLSIGGSAFPSVFPYTIGLIIGWSLFHLWQQGHSPNRKQNRLLPYLPAMALLGPTLIALSEASLLRTRGQMEWHAGPLQESHASHLVNDETKGRKPLRLLVVQASRRFSQEKPLISGTSPEMRFQHNKETEEQEFLKWSDMTQAALNSAPWQPDLVVLPESLVPTIYSVDPESKARLSAFEQELGIPLLVHYADIPRKEFSLGSASADESEALAAASLAEIRPPWATTSILPYQKQMLMPYGEYLPWRLLWEKFLPQRALSLVPRLNDVPSLGEDAPLRLMRQLDPAASEDHLALDEVRIGVSICFDGISPDIARSQALAGADVLINLSNLEWMGSAASESVFSAVVRIRSIETGLPTVFVNNAGGTAAFDSQGRTLLKPLAHGSAQAVFVEVPLHSEHQKKNQGHTFFVRNGHGPVAWSSMVGLILIGFGLRRRFVSHRTSTIAGIRRDTQGVRAW